MASSCILQASASYIATRIFQPPFGYGESQISIFAEIPDFVVPLGSAAYNSTITNHTEVLPVSVDILGMIIFEVPKSLFRLRICRVSTRY